MSNAPTVAAARALTSLVDFARSLAERCDSIEAPIRAGRIREIATTLDSARTRLVEDGAEYIEAAWAFVDAGRRQLAQHHTSVRRIERNRARASAIRSAAINTATSNRGGA